MIPDTTPPTPALAAFSTPLLRHKSGPWTRLLSLGALLGMLYLLSSTGRVVYHLISDSIVAPIILSPDSDVVIQSKLNLGRLQTERQTIAARIEDNKASITAAEQAMARLKDLQTASARALVWSTAIVKKQESASTSDLQALDEQREVLVEAVRNQEAELAEARKNLAAGLVHKSDLAREESGLRQLRIAALQNERDHLAADVLLHRQALAKSALSQGKTKSQLLTPEMLAGQDQSVRVELELLRIDAERRSKSVQQHADEQELSKIDELVAQMKARPIFRAIDSSQNVAFVPYTQINGVSSGATVHDCAIWGVFSCNVVGQVAELLPGEVAMQDPWGTPTRGQYAILDLFDPAAARSKSLRIRGGSTHQPGHAPVVSER
jgi:hypothetical protein